MNNTIKLLYDKTRSTMMDFEEVNKTINSIEDKNLLNIKLKERLKDYSNTCLSDLLIFNDFLYQLIDTADTDEMELILQEFMLDGGDDE